MVKTLPWTFEGSFQYEIKVKTDLGAYEVAQQEKREKEGHTFMRGPS